MLFNAACFTRRGICLALFITFTAAAPPRSRLSAITMMDLFSFSAGMTIDQASTTITAWDTSMETPEPPRIFRSTKTSHSCNNALCFPLPTWPKSETQPTSTSIPASGSTASACLHSPPPSQTQSAMRFNFTETCDGDSDMAEDCRVTLDCDASQGLYPTCERGECKCLSKACFKRSMCLSYRQCREFDEHVCMKEKHKSDGMGSCGCQPRITECLFQKSPHHYCAKSLNCTERHFSLYPEFPYCSTGDSKYPLGRCECRHFDCSWTGDESDYEVCKNLVDCDSSPLGSRPFCSLKYGNESTSAQDGYCTCGS
ncbi:hypothetical protein HDV63DRAFT_114881 [Trichoderma sp. SZMC 28014]